MTPAQDRKKPRAVPVAEIRGTLVLSLCKLFYQLGVKGWQVIWSAGRDQALVAVDFLIYPGGTCIAQVGLQGREGRQGAALEGFSISQDPSTVADRAER